MDQRSSFPAFICLTMLRATLSTAGRACVRPLANKIALQRASRQLDFHHGQCLCLQFSFLVPARSYGTGSTRSSNQFTFSTKYPRQKKLGGIGKGKGKTAKTAKRKRAGKQTRIPGLALPPRLRLATFKHGQPKQAAAKKPPKPEVKSGGKIGERQATAVQVGRRTPGPRRRIETAQSKRAQLAKEEEAAKVARHTAKFALASTQYDTARPESLAVLKDRIRQSRFETMGLRPEIVKALTEGLGHVRPTEVQALCIPQALENPYNPILCAAETGSGKTLAYLVPVMNQLKQEEEDSALADKSQRESSVDIIEAITADGRTVSATSGLSSIRKIRRPRAVVIVPSRELVGQVTKIAKEISHIARLRVVGVHSAIPRHVSESMVATAPVDVLITTPGALIHLMESEGVSLSQTRHVVVDEADTMFDEGFGSELKKVLAPARAFASELKRPCQFVFVSATLPRTVVRILDRDFPNITRITTPSLHRTLPRLRQAFLRIDGSTTKQQMCLDVLKRAVVDDSRIIIFCNTRRSCGDLADFLRRKEYDAVDISSTVDVKERTKALARFAQAPSKGDEEGDHVGKPMIAVATDIASRGLDTTNVGHVILYDFPQTAIDYLHRVGRTARNGAKGRATSIIAKKDRKLAMMIEQAVKRKTVLT
ncbi:uncharacterized protein SPPG_02713 [Spizellomyces punctatus DAOM BR117]|uniref:P-loop containing nucleoside triphosphate hydrolase protein n=1 Tax=Spizellomyces punctatus (strain DAOM BR117) TaxID=645134 RepID=A0A0L0HLC0_SPIPD|nr:uncharacterized protein SPPG_02713 [Spizellomyces punctatus DAOM BR117]KND02231.1 hypothetical protein SPPG_02713 [Spizellomyces punctatus DAOM BR117]|eukprot:XP_016610270.1 hypothetical protein SPPG_02713 [Spizellomyces punctatus DAOM BR117]